MLCISSSNFLRIDRSYRWEVNSGPSGYNNITKSENVRNNVHVLLVTGNIHQGVSSYICMTMHFKLCLIQCVALDDHNHKRCEFN